MKKRFLFVVILLVLVCIPFGFRSKDASAHIVYLTRAVVVPADSAQIDDLLDIVNLINGPGMPQPPTEFRTGHMTASTSVARLEQTAYGYSLNLPSNNGVPTPTLHDGKLYVSGGFGSKQYFCFDAKTGEQIWAADLDDDGPSSGVIEDGILVFNTESCTIFAAEARTGKHLWSFFLGDPLMSTPTVANGLVFTAFPAYFDWAKVSEIPMEQRGDFYPSHVLIAMDLATGKIRWEKWIDGDVMTAPVAEGNKLHVVSFPGTYFVIDQQTGEFESAKRLRGTSAPTLAANGVFISRRSDTREGQVSESIGLYSSDRKEWSTAYDKTEAPYLDYRVQETSELKQLATMDDAGNGFAGGAPSSSGYDRAMVNVGQSNVSSLQAYTGSRTLHYKDHNFNTLGDSLICTHGTSGDVKWAIGLKGDIQKVGGFLGSPPIQVGNRILVATYVGEVLLINPENGKVERSFSTGENLRTTPVAMDGWIYVGTTKGSILAIRTDDPTITGWPMLGKNPAHTN